MKSWDENNNLSHVESKINECKHNDITFWLSFCNNFRSIQMSNFWAFLWEALMPDPISAAPNYPMWCYYKVETTNFLIWRLKIMFLWYSKTILVHYIQLKVWVVIVTIGMSYLGKHTNGSWHSKKYRVVAATLS
jgi:hypothetical protein